MVTKKRSLVTEFTKILEAQGIIDPLLVGKLVGVVEVVYAPKKRAGGEEKSDPRARPFLLAFQSHIGYPIANFGKEMVWANWLFKHGYSEQQILACYEDMKCGWWSDKAVSLSSISQHIGEFVARGQPKPPPMVKPVAAPLTDIQKRQQADQARIKAERQEIMNKKAQATNE